MSKAAWFEQGVLLGSSITVRDWEMNKRITAAADLAVAELPKVIDPAIYNMVYQHAKEEEIKREAEEIALRTHLNAMAF